MNCSQYRFALLAIVIASRFAVPFQAELPGDVEDETNHLDIFLAQASEQQEATPEIWAAWNKEVHQQVEMTERFNRANPRMHVLPPVRLENLSLPLSFLFDRLTKDDGKLSSAYLRAVVVSDDELAMHALADFFFEHPHLGEYHYFYFLGGAKNQRWIEKTVQRAIDSGIAPTEYSLSYYLINKYRTRLPKQLRKRAYTFIRNSRPEGPPEGPWELLFSLDQGAARDDIFEYFGTTYEAPGSYFNGARRDKWVVSLLRIHTGVDSRVARMAADWIATADDKTRDALGSDLFPLRLLLVQADPSVRLQSQLGPTLRRMEWYCSKDTLTPNEAHWFGLEARRLIHALRSTDHPKIEQLRDVADREEIQDDVKADIKNWLATAPDEHSPR